MKRKAKVTYIIIGMLIIAFVIDCFIWNREGTKIFTVDHIVKGASWGYLTKYGRLLNVRSMNTQWWRLLTCVFLHNGVIKLCISIFGLCFIGPIVERSIGSFKMVVCFILSGVISSVITMFISYGSMGAGGAIYGLIGIMIVLIIRDRKNCWSPVFIVNKLLIVEYLILSNVTGVDMIITQEVGFITGILLGFVFVGAKQSDKEKRLLVK